MILPNYFSVLCGVYYKLLFDNLVRTLIYLNYEFVKKRTKLLQRALQRKPLQRKLKPAVVINAENVDSRQVMFIMHLRQRQRHSVSSEIAKVAKITEEGDLGYWLAL